MNVIIIGGGPAGMVSAISAKKAGASKVTILEKMPLLGKKLLITGKGRCNITSSLNISEFIRKYPWKWKIFI